MKRLAGKPGPIITDTTIEMTDQMSSGKHVTITGNDSNNYWIAVFDKEKGEIVFADGISKEDAEKFIFNQGLSTPD